MSTFVVTPCFTAANATAKCCRQPLLQQQPRGLCLTSTSPPLLSNHAIPVRSSQLGLRGLKLSQTRLQGRPRADSETTERPSRADGNGRAKGGLDELDNQLRVLSSSDSVFSAPKDASEGNDTRNGEKPPSEEYKKVDWPVFGDGFVLYVSVGLILLTIVNNVLFRIFLGPPVPRDPPPHETVAPQERQARYKLRSYNDPKYFENVPSVTDEPLLNKH